MVFKQDICFSKKYTINQCKLLANTYSVAPSQSHLLSCFFSRAKQKHNQVHQVVQINITLTYCILIINHGFSNRIFASQRYYRKQVPVVESPSPELTKVKGSDSSTQLTIAFTAKKTKCYCFDVPAPF